MSETLFIIVIIVLQIAVFSYTGWRIWELFHFFPKGLGSLQVIKARLSRQTLNTPKQFRHFLRTFSEEELAEADEVVEVELLEIELPEKNRYQQFNQVLFSTNSYLCKNKGTAADFNVLKDICERRIESLDEEIHGMLNVPLYLGLGGYVFRCYLGRVGY